MRSPIARIVLVLLVAGVLLPVAALAAAKTFDDQQGDGGMLDIRSVEVRKTSDGMLRHVINTYGSWNASNLAVAATPPPSLCFDIWTTRTAGEDRPNYLLCAAPTSDGRRMRGTLATVPVRGRARRVLIAEVDRPDDRSIAIEISARQIGKPKRYRFLAETTMPLAETSSPAASCNSATPCTDFAPPLPQTQLFKP